MTIRIYVGTNAAAQTIVFPSQSSIVPSSYCECEILATVQSTGSSGTYIASGALYVLTSSSTQIQNGSSSASTTTVDTTQANPVVTVTAQWALSSSNNILLVQNAVIEIVKA
jgi:hypothetical protein